jgi:hypothetical protein
MAYPKDITKWNRLEFWLPGGSASELTLYNWVEPPKKTLSRLAAFKPPTYGGQPDITKQYKHRFYSWEVSTLLSGIEVLRLEKLVKQADELVLNPAQQFIMLKDFYSPISLAIRGDLTSAVIKSVPDTTPPSGIAPIAYCAHNVVISAVEKEREFTNLLEPSCSVTLSIQEVV